MVWSNAKPEPLFCRSGWQAWRFLPIAAQEVRLMAFQDSLGLFWPGKGSGSSRIPCCFGRQSCQGRREKPDRPRQGTVADQKGDLMGAGRRNGASTAIVTLDGLRDLLPVLRRRGFRVVDPILRDRADAYDDIEPVENLPRGWTDEQDGGRYRLCRCGCAARRRVRTLLAPARFAQTTTSPWARLPRASGLRDLTRGVPASATVIGRIENRPPARSSVADP